MAEIQEMRGGEKIKKLREDKGMSLAELAESSGFSSASTTKRICPSSWIRKV